MNVFVAEAEPELRSALQTVLVQVLGLKLVGQTSESEGLLGKIQATHPALVLLDWELPGLLAADLIAALRAPEERPVIIVLSIRPGAEQAALTAGVDAFISKADPPEQLLQLLRGFVESHSGVQPNSGQGE